MKKWKSLYLELLRQQKICGLVFAICGILCASCIFIAFGASDASENITVSAFFYNPYAYFVMLIGGTAFPLAGFAYLNKRNSADVFHAIPVSRLELFSAAGAAVFSWLTVLQLAGYLVMTLGYLFLGVSFSFLQGIYECINLLTGTWVMAAGTLLAAGLSGTTLTALAASLVINFVPRIFMTGLAVNITHSDLLAIDRAGILSPQYQTAFGIPFGSLLFSMFGTHIGAEGDRFLASYFPAGLPALYTFLLTLLLLALAAFAFSRRKSETAGQPAVNGIVQHIIRCGVASPFLLGLMMLYSDSASYDFDQSAPWIIILASLGVYVIYELLSRRSFKHTAKTLPVFLLMAVIILGSGPAAYQIGRLAEKKVVPAEEIQSVCFDGGAGIYPMDTRYHAVRYGRVEFDSDEIKELAAKALAETVEESQAESSFYRPNTIILRTKFDTGAGGFTRYLRFTSEELRQLAAIVSSDEQVLAQTADLPESSELERISLYGGVTYGITFSDADRRVIWDTAREEYLSFTPEQKKEYYRRVEFVSEMGMTAANEAEDSEKNQDFGRIEGFGFLNGREYVLQLVINEYFPKTGEKIAELTWSKQDFAGTAELIRRMDSNDYRRWDLWYFGPDGSSVRAADVISYLDRFDSADRSEPTEEEYEQMLANYHMQYVKGTDIFGTLQEFAEHPETIADAAMEMEALLPLAELLEKKGYVPVDMTKGYYRFYLEYSSEEGYTERNIYFSIQ